MKNWMRFAAVISFTITVAHGAFSASLPAAVNINTGNDFYRYCRDDFDRDELTAGMCFGFVKGIGDMHFVDEKVNGGPLAPALHYCAPRGATLRQLTDVGVKWLSDHPEKRSGVAALLLIEAFASAFPCADRE